MNTFRQDLQAAVDYHGHLCSGQITGTRMARLALQTLGIDDPKNSHELIVYVECDRCLADAIGTVTGCKLGKRSLKSLDYGKSAASFLNLATGEAIRISRKERIEPPGGADLIDFFEGIPDEDLFNVRRIKINYRPEDLPGKPLDSVVCSKCNENVMDGRQVVVNGLAMCKSCAQGAYYDYTD